MKESENNKNTSKIKCIQMQCSSWLNTFFFLFVFLDVGFGRDRYNGGRRGLDFSSNIVNFTEQFWGKESYQIKFKYKILFDGAMGRFNMFYYVKERNLKEKQKRNVCM